MNGSISRRRLLLLGTAIGGPGLATLFATRPARAFSTESIAPGSSLGVAYANRCGTDGEHAQIRSALAAQLATRSAAPGQTLSASQVCPICGCPIIATRTVY